MQKNADCNSAGGLGGPNSGDCPGWGGYSDGWENISFDLSDYSGQDAIVRFAFYSDPAYSSIDEPTATGFQVDNIVIGSAFSDTADDESTMAISGSMVKVVGWYDNEWGYSCRTADLASYITDQGF